MFCSFADLQKPQVELDGKACAAVGQNSLMALYDTFFNEVVTHSLFHGCIIREFILSSLEIFISISEMHVYITGT